MINLPYYGHVIPIIGLVQELISLGCDVTYLMLFDLESIVNESGAKFVGPSIYPRRADLINYQKQVDL